jgi:hypothetical protein
VGDRIWTAATTLCSFPNSLTIHVLARVGRLSAGELTVLPECDVWSSVMLQ